MGRWLILSPEVQNNLFCLLGVQNEVVVLAPDLQLLHLLPTGCIVVVGDAAFDDGIICERSYTVGGMREFAVVGDEGE